LASLRPRPDAESKAEIRPAAQATAVSPRLAALSHNCIHTGYDSDGNLKDDPVTPATGVNGFDADGHATTLQGITVTFDALGRPVEAAKTGGTEEFLYGPGGGKLAVMSGSTLVSAYVPLPGGAEAVYNGSGLAAYHHADWEGSARLASTPSQTLSAVTAYGPYGEIYAETGAGAPDRSFTGQKQDIDTAHSGGQYDFLNREYNPIQGRWWTPDPAGLGAADPNSPQSWNRYAYVSGSPLEATDPSGLCGIVFGGITQSPGSPGGRALISYARSIGADVAFGLPASGLIGGASDVGSILFGSAGASVGAAALRDAASQPGPLDVITFSGGAQTFLNSLSSEPGLANKVHSVTYYSPGTSTPSLFSAGPTATMIVSGAGLADDLATLGSDFSLVPAVNTGCRHDFPCEVGVAPPLGTGGECENPKIFTPSGSSPLGGTGGGTAANQTGGGGLSLLGLGGVTGNWAEIIGMYLKALMPVTSVTTSQGPQSPHCTSGGKPCH
jgi:RHS repeat-associated protein